MTNFERFFYEDVRETKKANSGFYGKMKAQYGHKIKIDDLICSVESKPKDMLVRRVDGVEIVIPADWFTKTGKIKKSKLQAYKELLGA